MFIFIIVSFLFSQNNYSSYQLDPANYFCKSNYAFKILKISDEELIFYGTEGGVLRTYDGGETWHQNYTGLDNDDIILKMIYSDGKLIGVTYQGKLMISYDKGDYWEIRHVSNSLSAITKLNNELYYSCKNDSIYVSKDNGNTWIGKNTGISYIESITSQGDNLIISNNSKVFVFDEDLNLIKELDMPFQINKRFDKFENLYVSDSKNIAKLNNELEWEEYNIFDENRDFAIYPNKNDISIFTYLKVTGNLPVYQQFNYQIKEVNLHLLSEFRNINLYNNTNDLAEFKTIDIEFLNNKFILSNYHKTIISINQSKNWDIISYSQRDALPYSNISFDQINLTNFRNVFSLRSLDTCNTYNIIPTTSYIKSYNYKGEMVNDTVSPKIEYIKPLNSNQDLVIFNESKAIKNTNEGTNNHKFFGIYYKNEKSIEMLNIDLKFPFPTSISPFSFLGEIKNDYYFTRSFRKLGLAIYNPYLTYFYKLDSKTLLLDTIHVFEDSLKYLNFYFEDEKIWAVGINEENRKNIKLYYSEDNGENFELKQSFELIKKHPLFLPIYTYITKNKENELIVFSDYQIHKINSDDYSYSTVELDFTLKPYIYNFSEKYFEDFIFSRVEIKDSVQQDDLHLSYLSFNQNEINFNNLYQYNSKDKESFIPIFTLEDNQIIFRKSTTDQLYFPIEEERLTYYNSVEKLEPPSIWTFPPYPNPVKDNLSIKFFSGKMNDIFKTKIELIEIGTGRRIHIDKFHVNYIDKYYGEINFNIPNVNKGAYLVTFKLGNSNKSESIIIE